MKFIINIYYVFVTVVSYHYVMKSTFQYDLDKFYNFSGGRIYRPGIDRGLEGCNIPVRRDNPSRPIPTGLNETNIDNPLRTEYRVDPGDFLRFACDSGRILKTKKEFIQPEIILQCQYNNTVAFRHETVYYDDFSCVEFPSFADVHVNSSAKRHLKREIGGYDCFLQMHDMDYYQPIPFTANTSEPIVIYPDQNGNLIINRDDYFRLSCSGRGNEFMSPPPRGKNELLVKCLNGTYLEYQDKVYTFFDFVCAEEPSTEFRLTNITCNHRRHNVFEVGYRTHFYFLPLYRICFDTVYKNAKYSWYYVDTPVYVTRQIPKYPFIKFIQTDVYGPEVEPIDSYNYFTQIQVIRRILRSTKMANYYINYDLGRTLVPGQLVSSQAFVYSFQQKATFYYENTVPQWQIYTKRVWKNLQLVLNEKLSKDYTRHLIVTGVMDMCHLVERGNKTHPIFLSLPWNIAVPKYIWKLDYDVDRKNGTVYIGLNNPYKTIDMETYFCEAMPCPTKLLARHAFRTELLFCCTKEDFERTYGPVDPVVYEDIAGHK